MRRVAAGKPVAGFFRGFLKGRWGRGKFQPHSLIICRNCRAAAVGSRAAVTAVMTAGCLAPRRTTWLILALLMPPMVVHGIRSLGAIWSMASGPRGAGIDLVWVAKMGPMLR